MGAKEEDLQCDPKTCLFARGVGIFELIFLSHFLTKMRTFCAHQKGNFLNFSKLTLLLSIVHFWDPLWPVKHKRAFFLDTLQILRRTINFNIQNSRSVTFYVIFEICILEWKNSNIQKVWYFPPHIEHLIFKVF